MFFNRAANSKQSAFDSGKVLGKKKGRLTGRGNISVSSGDLQPTMHVNQLIITAIALIGISAGSFCLARWAKYPEAADFKLKAYAIFNTMVGTFSLTYVMINVLRSFLQ